MVGRVDGLEAGGELGESGAGPRLQVSGQWHEVELGRGRRTALRCFQCPLPMETAGNLEDYLKPHQLTGFHVSPSASVREVSVVRRSRGLYVRGRVKQTTLAARH